MGCCFSFLYNRDTSDNGKNIQEDTVPLASIKKKSKQDSIRSNNSFARMMPLLEERDQHSTFESVKEQRRLSINDSISSSSTISFEHEFADSVRTNEFLHQILGDNDTGQSQQYQNSPNIPSTPNRQTINHSDDLGILYDHPELIKSTDDEGGISGEMDSSNDDS